MMEISFKKSLNIRKRKFTWTKKKSGKSRFRYEKLKKMLMGIKALHDLKILHRDLKSANIFLFKDGTAKIGDMNVSKIAKKGLLETQTGTPYYASPEVWNESSYDFKYT